MTGELAFPDALQVIVEPLRVPCAVPETFKSPAHVALNDPFAEFDVCSVAFHLKSTQVEGAGTMLPDAEAQVPISAATLVALGLVRVVLFS